MHSRGDTLSPSSTIATAIAIVGLLGVAAAIFFSLVIRAFGCDDADGCSGGGTALVVIACAGALPVIGMLVESRRRRGHPWYWFIAAAFVYAFWGVVFMSLAG
jgi:hypothetical protein